MDRDVVSSVHGTGLLAPTWDEEGSTACWEDTMPWEDPEWTQPWTSWTEDDGVRMSDGY